MICMQGLTCIASGASHYYLQSVYYVHCALTVYLQVSSADNFRKHFGTRSGPTKVGPDLDPNCLSL